MNRGKAWAAIGLFCVATGSTGWYYGIRPEHRPVEVVHAQLGSHRVLTLTVLVRPGCEERLRVGVSETAVSVRVGARVERDLFTPCAGEPQRKTKFIPLKAPLGDRPVIDDVAGRPLAVAGR